MSTLFAPVVSITRTKRRRFQWAAWWLGPPTDKPFRVPDAFAGGALTEDEAQADAERVAGMRLIKIQARWGRAWARVRLGQPPWLPKGPSAPSDCGAGDAQDVGKVHANAKVAASRVGRSVWEILQVARTASLEEIKRAYRERMLVAHPDHGGSTQAFQQLKRAFAEAVERAAKPKPRAR